MRSSNAARAAANAHAPSIKTADRRRGALSGLADDRKSRNAPAIIAKTPTSHIQRRVFGRRHTRRVAYRLFGGTIVGTERTPFNARVERPAASAPRRGDGAEYRVRRTRARANLIRIARTRSQGARSLDLRPFIAHVQFCVGAREHQNSILLGAGP